MNNEIKFSPSLELFIVMNEEGRYFRSIGYKSYGEPGKNWVGDMNQAKVYTKIGQARSRVTFFANNYPKYGVPDIIKLTVDVGEILDESKRVENVLANIERQELIRLKAQKDRDIKEAERKFQEIKEALRKLKSQ